MEITENIADSVTYPLSEIKNLAIFALLLLSGVLIVTIPLFSGYVYRIIKESAEGSDILPEFDDLGQMYIDGLKYLCAGLIYGIVVGIIATVLISIGIYTENNTLTILMAIISALLLIIVFGFVYAATFNMINKDDFGAAFDFATILGIIQNIGIGDYIIWFVAIIIIGVIANTISSFLSWTILIPLIINSWLYCFQARSMALRFAYE